MRATLPLTALVLLAAGPAAADSSLRCDRGIVSVGDTKLDLLGKCGVPTLRDVREVERGQALVAQDGVIAVRGRSVAAEVEQWTYDFGPNHFTQLVTLEGGKITAIERGSYGYPTDAAREVPGIPVARCDSSALQEGATKLDLLAKCGAPASIDRRTVERGATVDAGGGKRLVSSTVELEVWSYNFGPNRFLHLVTLENGRVIQVERGGYGYPP